MVLDAIERLPADATLTEIRERIEFLSALKDAEESIDRGEYIPHEEVEQAFASWVKQWHSK